MTGVFTTKDHARCRHYARFMQHLTVAQALAIFWLLFICVLVLMCVAAYQHHSTIPDTERGVPARRYRQHVQRLRRRYLGIVTICFLVSVVCVMLECFALFNIEYCDGEDLMQLYWGFWSVVQVEAWVAAVGRGAGDAGAGFRGAGLDFQVELE
ncbi:hypothetical protein LOCC1_G007613 [Lachnellula occidentalis]|uniref:Uncharacterized protein n=1 Tax=Lachnellula occidentalis TaxID=215460 RepID=A0A8H8RQI4_9HELO|nr:hypothetical protein LOCC1_G007613 [Lachnellula occidentalis]